MGTGSAIVVGGDVADRRARTCGATLAGDAVGAVGAARGLIGRSCYCARRWRRLRAPVVGTTDAVLLRTAYIGTRQKNHGTRYKISIKSCHT
jgi:hypothetical protein